MTEADSLASLCEALAQEPADIPKLTFEGGPAGSSTVSGPELWASATAFASAMAAKVPPGSRVLLAASSDRTFVASLLGCCMAGLIAVPVPPHSTGRGAAGAARRVAAIRDDAQPAAWVGDAAFGAVADPAGTLVDLSSWVDEDRSALQQGLPAVRPDDIAILQYTSGSTSVPKGSVLRHRAVIANLRRAVADFGLGASDRIAGWLPLHHDMGLFGLMMTPLFVPGMVGSLRSPDSFRSDPLSWLSHLSEFGATITAAPASSLAVLNHLLSHSRIRFDLSVMRNLVVGAEPISPVAAQEFLDRLAGAGLRPDALKPAYGLAEATLFVTKADGLQVVPVHHETGASAVGPFAATDSRKHVCVGPIDRQEVRLRGGEHGVAPARADTAAEIEIRLPSLFSGYWAANGVDDTDISDDGWFRTGDVGLCWEGQLVVLGRMKDQINVGGAKVFPVDVERAVAAGTGVPESSVAAFGLPHPQLPTESIAVAVECRAGLGHVTREAVAQACFEESGVRPAAVVHVVPGGLPRTTSGKVQRFELRNAFSSDALRRCDDPGHAHAARAS